MLYLLRRVYTASMVMSAGVLQFQSHPIHQILGMAALSTLKTSIHSTIEHKDNAADHKTQRVAVIHAHVYHM